MADLSNALSLDENIDSHSDSEEEIIILPLPLGERETGTIYFYTNDPVYSSFSNFSRHPITLRDKEWPTVEHYFQAQKFANTPFEEQIRLCGKPSRAKKLGNDRGKQICSYWDKVRDIIMKEALLAKYTQHNNLTTLLVETGNRRLVEKSATDSYWGSGRDGNGKNKLGLLLMDVRDEIRCAQEKKQIEIEVYDWDAKKGSSGINKHKTTTSEKKKKRRKRTQERRGVFKDATGRSLFSLQGNQSGTNSVDLEGEEGINISMKALPSAGKYVLKQHQYVKRFDNLVDEEDEEEDEEDEVWKEQQERRNACKKPTLFDFVGGEGTKWNEEEGCALVGNEKKWIEDVEGCMNILKALNNDNEDVKTVAKLNQKCKFKKAELVSVIQAGGLDSSSESDRAKLFEILDSLNTL